MWASTNDDVEELRRLYRVSSHNVLGWVTLGEDWESFALCFVER
jgi:hypothetical protein